MCIVSLILLIKIFMPSRQLMHLKCEGSPMAANGKAAHRAAAEVFGSAGSV